MLLLLASLLLTALTLWGVGDRSFTYYPAITYTSVTARTLSGFISYGLLTWLPAIITGKEALKWHCLRSKI